MKYERLLFDADGTLFDYDKAEAVSLESAFGQAGFSFKKKYSKLYRQINGQIWQDFEKGLISQDRLRIKRFELLFDAVKLKTDPWEFSKKYLESLSKCTYLLEDAEEVVSLLSKKAGLILLTNGLKDVQRSRWSKSVISRYFTDILISEEVGAAKPDRKMFDEAFNRMNNPDKEKVLMVGDGLTSDIKGGMDYGIDTCWFNPLELPRDPDIEIGYEIKHLRELLGIVGDP
jgi:YjjG family noncanonical pyrimidine nucleotidase